MSNIFISYKREDKPRAKKIARALQNLGYSVWWDRKIPPGKSFDRVIQEALDQASCVVVLWSEASIRSDWVKEEAEKGKQRGILVPALIDDVSIPLGFGRLQTASLVDWDGDPKQREFARLTQSIARLAQGIDATSLLVTDSLLEGLEETEDGPPPEVFRQEVVEHRKRAARPVQGGEASGRRPVLFATAVVVLALSTGVAGFLVAQNGSLESALGDAAAVEATGPAGPTVDSVVAALDAVPEAVNPVPEPLRPPPAVLDAPATAEPAARETPADMETLAEAEASADVAPADVAPAVDPALEAYRKLSDLQERAQDAGADAAELLGEYEELWTSHRQAFDAEAAGRIFRAIESLRESIESVESVEALDTRDDLTVLERLAHWRELAAENPESRAGVQAAKRVAELEAIVDGAATITADDRFVTCASIDRTDGARPVGIRDRFGPGTVYVYARVNSPRSQERLKLEWRDAEGNVSRTQDVTVGRNTGAGYRIFYGKQHAAGSYEVRLLNADGLLIGRRAFEVR